LVWRHTGHASDNSGVTTYRVMALEMDEHPAYVPLEYGTLYFTLMPEALGLGPNIAMD